MYISAVPCSLISQSTCNDTTAEIRLDRRNHLGARRGKLCFVCRLIVVRKVQRGHDNAEDGKQCSGAYRTHT